MSMLRSRSGSNIAGEDSDVESEEENKEESNTRGSGASIRKQMMVDTLQLMCDKVSEFAVEFRFLHRDNIMGNVLVIANGTEILDVNIVDWGGRFLSTIEEDVTREDLLKWCNHRWSLSVWESQLHFFEPT